MASAATATTSTPVIGGVQSVDSMNNNVVGNTTNNNSIINNNSNAMSYSSASLYVGDLLNDVSEGMLYEVFNSVGPVASIRVCRDAVTRRSLGYAYVNYVSVQDAERALDTLNYTCIKNHPCRIMWSHRDPSLRRSGTGNIFVKNLDKSIDNKALFDTFSLFGNILSCKVAVDIQGKSKGYGFVHYETENSAKIAIEKVNQMLIGGKTVYVGPFVKCGERQSTTDQRYTNIYIKNFPSKFNEETKLATVFHRYGDVTSFALRYDAKYRPFAFCNYRSPDAAKTAVEVLNGRCLKDDGSPMDDDELKKVEDKVRLLREKAGKPKKKKVPTATLR